MKGATVLASHSAVSCFFLLSGCIYLSNIVVSQALHICRKEEC